MSGKGADDKVSEMRRGADTQDSKGGASREQRAAET